MDLLIWTQENWKWLLPLSAFLFTGITCTYIGFKDSLFGKGGAIDILGVTFSIILVIFSIIVSPIIGLCVAIAGDD